MKERWFPCRVENLEKFKNADEDSLPALVCTDLAARGLDLVCDHVINFDFPLNPVSEFLDGYAAISSSVLVLSLPFFSLSTVLFPLHIKGFCDLCCEEKYEVFVSSRCFCVGVSIRSARNL